jgi:hypothetical protein
MLSITLLVLLIFVITDVINLVASVSKGTFQPVVTEMFCVLELYPTEIAKECLPKAITRNTCHKIAAVTPLNEIAALRTRLDPFYCHLWGLFFPARLLP